MSPQLDGLIYRWPCFLVSKGRWRWGHVSCINKPSSPSENTCVFTCLPSWRERSLLLQPGQSLHLVFLITFLIFSTQCPAQPSLQCPHFFLLASLILLHWLYPLSTYSHTQVLLLPPILAILSYGHLMYSYLPTPLTKEVFPSKETLTLAIFISSPLNTSDLPFFPITTLNLASEMSSWSPDGQIEWPSSLAFATLSCTVQHHQPITHILGIPASLWFLCHIFNHLFCSFSPLFPFYSQSLATSNYSQNFYYHLMTPPWNWIFNSCYPLDEPIFAWNVPLVSLIFLKRSLVFPILLYSFSYLEPVCCSMSSSNCCFLTCI